MTAKERMVNRFDESTSGRWYGPSLYKLVENLGIEEAVDKPLPHRHTIWEILNARARMGSTERVDRSGNRSEGKPQ